jgi:hypothetical protein
MEHAEIIRIDKLRLRCWISMVVFLSPTRISQGPMTVGTIGYVQISITFGSIPKDQLLRIPIKHDDGIIMASAQV